MSVRLPASSAFKWVECNGSPTLEQSVPKIEKSEEQKLGDLAHWMAEKILKSYQAPSTKIITPMEMEGETGPNKMVVDEEIGEQVGIYTTHILQIADGNMSRLAVENELYCDRVMKGQKIIIDAWFYDGNKGVIYIRDLKFGHGIVNAYMNWQLIMEAMAILDHLGIDGLKDQHIKVNMGIVQPRAFRRNGPIDTWEVMACDLRAYFNQLTMAAADAQGPSPKCKTGPWCLKCNAKGRCDTLDKDFGRCYDYVSETLRYEPTPDELDLELDVLEHAFNVVKARKQGLEDLAIHKLREGEFIKGRGIEDKKSNEKWTCDNATLDMIGLMIGKDLKKGAKYYTPSQVINELGIDRSVISAYITRDTTGTKLVKRNTKALAEQFKRK